MQAVISKVNSVCSRLLDNAELTKLMPENSVSDRVDGCSGGGGATNKFAALGLKNSRRKMEDRHVVIQDFNELYRGKVNRWMLMKTQHNRNCLNSLQESPRCSYYALFDGHGGAEAAIYSVAHLAYYLRNSISYPDDPENAITDAFVRTDQAIISKYDVSTDWGSFLPLPGN